MAPIERNRTRSVCVTVRLLADEMHCYLSSVRPQPMFPEVDALPGTKRESTTNDRNRELCRRECRAHMGRHVVGTFVAISEQRIPIGRQPREEPVEIATDIGVIVFLHEQAGQRMAGEQPNLPAAEAACCQSIGNGPRDFHQAAAAGVEFERGAELAKHDRLSWTRMFTSLRAA